MHTILRCLLTLAILGVLSGCSLGPPTAAASPPSSPATAPSPASSPAAAPSPASSPAAAPSPASSPAGAAPSPASSPAAAPYPAATPLAAASASPSVVPRPSALPSSKSGQGHRVDFRRLLGEVERLRELKFKKSVPAYSQTADEVRAYLRRELERDAHWTADQAFLEQFGFVKKPFDLHSFLIDFYTEQVAGYYDYRTAAFYMSPHAMQSDPSMAVIQLMGMSASVEDSLVVHEMDHAMQDQHFGIKRLEALTQGPDHDDRSLAVQSLIEGDAYVVMMYSLLGAMGAGTDLPIAQMGDMDNATGMGGGPVFNRAPLYLQKMALFPYVQGGVFVDYYKQRGGWAAVNRIYANPPRSSEQILHPEKYAVAPDEPRTLTMPADPAHATLAENVMGEARMRVLWDQWAPNDPDRKTWSNDWGGDLFRIYGTPADHYMVWVTDWDDAVAAQRFCGAVRRVFEAKDGVNLMETSAGGVASNGRKTQMWSAVDSRGRVCRVERRGSVVVIIDGAPRDEVSRLLALASKTSGL